MLTYLCRCRLQREYGGAAALLYILDGEVLYDSSLPQPGGKRLKNLEYFGIPVLQQLAQLAGASSISWPCSVLTQLILITFCICCNSRMGSKSSAVLKLSDG